MIHDVFGRADTAAGVVGRATSGEAWSLTGTGFALCQIINNRLQSGDPLGGTNENFYLYFINRQRVKWMTAKVRWAAGATPQSLVLAANQYDPPTYPGFTTNLLHMNYGRTSASIQIFDGGTPITLISDNTLDLDTDIDHDVGWIVLGNQIISVGPGYVLSGVSNRVGIISTLVNSFYFQINSVQNTAQTRAFFSEIREGDIHDPIPLLFRGVL